MSDELKKHYELSFKSSMFCWYPKIKDLDIPQPKTNVVPFTEYERREIYHLYYEDTPVSKPLEDKLFSNAKDIEYPLFMRTDQSSGKHGWNGTCFVNNETVLMEHIKALVEWHEMQMPLGMPFGGMIFREYIEMAYKFKAFNGLPIPPERRYFIKNKKIVDRTPYWPEEAIRFYPETNEYADTTWKQDLYKMNKETPEEVQLLSGYCEMVAEQFDEYWSIDFCKGKDGTWYLIDMARGEVSWNPKDDQQKNKIALKDFI